VEERGGVGGDEEGRKMKLFRKLICRLFGHTSAKIPAVFFFSWDGLYEVGTLHCSRCGKMLGEYKRGLTEAL
jgi:hypothetical protein